MENNKLDKLGIYELRSLARSVGVKSPTTKKREELISLINDIKEGKTKPVLNNHFGRPVKQLSNTAELSSIVLNGDEELSNKIFANDKIVIAFNQELDESEYPESYNKIIVSGILRLTQSGTYYMLNTLKLNEKIYVILKKEDVDKFNLIEGDVVYGEAVKDVNKNCAYLKSIARINGNLIDVERKFCEEQELTICNSMLYDNIKEGYFNLIKKEDIDNSIDTISTLSKQLKCEGYKSVVIGFDISIQTKLKLNRIEDVYQITTTQEDTASFCKDCLFDTINYITAAQKREEKLVVFILDIFSIYHFLDIVYGNNNYYHCEEVENIIKRLISLARTTNMSSTTLIGFNYDFEQEYYQNELKTLTRLSMN